MPTRKSRTEAAAASPADHRSEKESGSTEILTIDEAIARYYGEWILMEVTEFDERRLPHKGRVAAHSHSRRRIEAAMDRLHAFSGESGPFYYLFSGYPRAYTGEQARAALSRAAEEDVVGAWRRW
jgi:hypothetical protein